MHEEAFFLDSIVDCIYYHGFLLILSPFNFERIFDFYALIEAKAIETLMASLKPIT